MQPNFAAVIDSRKRRPREVTRSSQSVEPAGSSLFEETAKGKGKMSARAQNRMTAAQLHELEAKREQEVRYSYQRVVEVWPIILKPDGEPGRDVGEREWLLEAEKLVETFRETRKLFLSVKVGQVCCLSRPYSMISC